MTTFIEPITDPSNIRYSLYPIIYKGIWNEYKKQQALQWRAEEIDFSKDYDAFLSLDANKQHVIKMILAFFANIDGIVNLNIGSRLLNEITISEARYAYAFQMMMENIHAETYSLMLDEYVKDLAEKAHLQNSIVTIPSIKNISDWAFKWIESDKPISYRIVAFACVEGIFFSGAFATIFWLKHYTMNQEQVMEGLCKSNEYISRDEQMHTDFACKLYELLENKLTQDEIYEIISDSVVVAKDFVKETFKCDMIGMSLKEMEQYVQYIADQLVTSLGYDKIFNSVNPFPFIDIMGITQKTNFHEKRPTEYSPAIFNSLSSNSLNYNMDNIDNIDF